MFPERNYQRDHYSTNLKNICNFKYRIFGCFKSCKRHEWSNRRIAKYHPQSLRIKPSKEYALKKPCRVNNKFLYESPCQTSLKKTSPLGYCVTFP
ncbi:hypothetical protein ACTXT7_002167 [Hymenolepis weldensis]